MGKKGKKENEIVKIPLPTKFKEDLTEDEESDLDPRMKKILANFKRLCEVGDNSVEEQFISIPSESKGIQLSCELEPGLSQEDTYMATSGDLVTAIKPQVKSDDYSGAKPVVITEKIGKKKMKKLRREEREKTKGKSWFDMPAPEMTEERKRDLELLKMRGVLDPKRFYKKSDGKDLPKYFQIGTVVDSPYDFYSDRIPTKARKRTMVDELLADAEFKKYNKRKYVEIIEAKKKKEGKVKHSKPKKKKVA